ncbi:MAG: hypothetical protein K5880_10250 [Hydrogenophaga sp.]|jgi:P-type conjugative transfer protein TrbJ|uniref:hypothetical protein n=1 Tax=Hydrogenophaga sp. TaxID=1904254 RepID=UPI00262C81BE|nr:hypothetical protein [Hydrogenophaga sp.]MCV0439004.1 hypothetical protein [Hydrogenophaga sp.]
MFKAKQLVVKVGFVATSFCAANAMAGAVAGGASEWTQIANNFQLIQVAMDSAASASAEASQYALQIQQFRTQINNLEKLGQLPSNIVANQSALEGLRAYTSALGQLQGSLGEQKSLMEKRFTEAKLTGASWDEYMAAVRKDASNKNKRAINRLEYEASVLDQVQKDYAEVRQYEPLVKESIGAQQSMQLMNQQMNRLLVQNARLTEVMVATMQEQTRSQTEKAVSAERSAIESQERFNQERAIEARRKAVADALRQSTK